MSIRKDDIKIFASERMTDNPDGGGRITGNEIVDGQSNNIFPDLGDVDTAYGRVAMRLVYPAVRTDGTETFLNSRLAIIEPPEDPIVSVVAFQAAGASESRQQAQNRVESYRVKGARYPGYLWSTQYAGSKAVTIFQHPSRPVPGVGDVLVLIRDEGTPEEIEQFVRITDIEVSVQEFNTEPCGDFKRRILNIDISCQVPDDCAPVE